MRLPYETIGRWTVFVIATALITVLILLALYVLLFLWIRGWKKVLNLCWKGYHPADEPPKGHRGTLALYAYAFYQLKRPKELPEEIKEAHRDS